MSYDCSCALLVAESERRQCTDEKWTGQIDYVPQSDTIHEELINERRSESASSNLTNINFRHYSLSL